MSVALPLRLVELGLNKAQVAGYFVIAAGTAGLCNLFLARNAASIRTASFLLGCSLTTAAGLVTLSTPAPSALSYFCAVAVVAITLNFPQYVVRAQSRTSASPPNLVSRIRMLYVLGYVAGLGLYSAGVLVQQALCPYVTPVRIAAVLALCTAVMACRLDREPGAGHPARRRGPEPAPRSADAGRQSLPAAVATVVLLRAADSLRQMYLPLQMVHHGFSGPAIATVLAISVLIELTVLVPIGRCCERVGSRMTLLIMSAVGVVAFTMMSWGPSVYGVLMVSQMLYAVFTAGFQSVGMVLLGEAFPAGLASGAPAYIALFQAGVVLGVVTPLLVSGYHRTIMLVGAAFCGIAAITLMLDNTIRRR